MCKSGHHSGTGSHASCILGLLLGSLSSSGSVILVPFKRKIWSVADHLLRVSPFLPSLPDFPFKKLHCTGTSAVIYYIANNARVQRWQVVGSPGCWDRDNRPHTVLLWGSHVNIIYHAFQGGWFLFEVEVPIRSGPWEGGEVLTGDEWVQNYVVAVSV